MDRTREQRFYQRNVLLCSARGHRDAIPEEENNQRVGGKIDTPRAQLQYWANIKSVRSVLLSQVFEAVCLTPCAPRDFERAALATLMLRIFAALAADAKFSHYGAL